MKRRNMVAEVMAERINYGGVCGTRWQVYQHALAATGSTRAADLFACGLNRPALSDAEAACLIPWDVFARYEEGRP